MEFISHCIKRNPNKLEGRATAGMLIIFLVLSLLGWIYLTQASHVATTSRRNQDLEAEKALLHQENMELMVEIATYESVSRLAGRAQELGFVAVAPDDAEFMAVAAPAPERLARSGASGGFVQVSAPERRSDPTLDGSSGDESSWAQSALGKPILMGVKSQFTAWIRSETQ